MARQVLPIVGAVIGAFYGNPGLGYAIGSCEGEGVDPEAPIMGAFFGGENVAELVRDTGAEHEPA